MSGGSGIDPYYQRDPPKKQTRKVALGRAEPGPGARTKTRRTFNVEDAYRLYLEGRSIQQVAKALGVSRSPVQEAFRQSNLKTRKPLKPKLEDVRRLYYDKGMSMRSVAEELGVSLHSVEKVFKEHGLKVRTRNYSDQDVKGLYDKGLSLKEAGRHFGVSERRVIQIFQRNQWEARSLRRTPIDTTLELLQQGYTQEECARRLGVSPGAISQLLKKMGLAATRNRDEKVREAQALARQYEKSKEWKRKRDEIRNRDNSTCRDCGLSPDKFPGVSLGVHHTEPLADWILGGHDPSDYPDNLLATMCENCHSKADALWKRRKNPGWPPK